MPSGHAPDSERPAVLVIAGADSSGGAGLTRDVQVLRDFGVEALCAVTAVTAQSNVRVQAVHAVPPSLVRAQIEAALATRPVAAVKIGMLGTGGVVDALIEGLPPRSQVPIVLDPVLVASSGGALLDRGGEKHLRQRLLARVTLVTPNLPESAQLLQADVATSEPALIEQARRMLAFGPQAVLIKGGHASGAEAIDWLVSADGSIERIATPRVAAERRGTGCTLATAIAAGLARGATLQQACREAKRYVLEWLRSS